MPLFSPSNMTSNTAPSPYVASTSSPAGGAPYLAFSGSAFSPWQGDDGGVDFLQLDLGAGLTRFSPQNMTSNTAPTPLVASVSSIWNSTTDAWNAFDASASSMWLGSGGGVDWLRLDVGSGNSFVMGAYDVQSGVGGLPARCPRNWTMQGSNDGTTWTTVDTRTNQTSWLAGQVRSFIPATQTTAYRYFRLNITANNGDATFTEVDELSLYAAGSASNVECLASYTIEQSTNTSEPLTRAPKNWTMQGSNDGNTWTTVDTQTNQIGWTSGLIRSYTCGAPSTTGFRFWKLNITANNGDGTWTTVGQLTLSGAPPVPPGPPPLVGGTDYSVAIDPATLKGVKALKIRSGTQATPVVQVSTVTLQLVTRVGVITTQIAAGNSLSAEVDIGDQLLLGLFVPKAWTTASVSFQVSPDGGATWGELTTQAGTPYVI
jgi:hypothetical protein